MLPLSYLGAAAAAFVAAMAALPWLAPELGGHYYHPRVLALTHAITLGWITMSILGASYQLIPIVLQRPLWSERLARWQLGLLLIGVIGMIAHFWIGTWPALASAAALVGLGAGMHVVNVVLSLHDFDRWTFTARLVVLGHVGLSLTVVFGFALALNHLWFFLPRAFFPSLHAHIHLALAWWIAPMLMGVSARVYPMFLLTPEPRGWPGRMQLWGLAVGAPVLVTGLVVWVISMARGRKRPGLDWGLRFVLAAAGFLPLGTVLGLALAFDLLSGPRVALAYAVLVLGGWASLSIVGMMLKIVPFLVWYRVYSQQLGRVQVPTLAALVWPAAEAAAWVLLTAGVLALALAAAWGRADIIAGSGLVLAMGALAFAASLGHALLHLARRPPAPAAEALAR